MLNVMSNRTGEDVPSSGQAALQIIDLVAILRRRRGLIIACTAICFMLGLLYVLVTPKMYTAQATLISDPKLLQSLRPETVANEVAFDPATVESQLETLKSERISTAVASNLKLTEDPEFVAPPAAPIPAAINFVKSLISAPDPDTEAGRLRKVINTISERMEAKRVGLSYAIAISFYSLDKEKSARIANAIAEAYITYQIQSKVEATDRASAWLQDRITELNEKVHVAENNVLSYRVKNGIVDISGKLVTEQQLVEANTALTAARNAAREAKARRDQIREVLKDDVPNAAVADALRSEVVNRLRSQYLELRGRENDLRVRYGATHELVKRATSDAESVARSMRDELRRIGESQSNDFSIASSNEASAEARLRELLATLSITREAQPELRRLEDAAQSVRTLAETFRQRLLVATQQVSFPISSTSVITPASPPTLASAPRTGLILAAALALGLVAGCGGALARELFDRRVRTTVQMEEAAQVSCLGILPRLPTPSGARVRADGGDPSKRIFTLLKAPGPSNIVVHQPFSLFAETIRNIKVSMDMARLSRDVRTLGVVSALAGEGKTTVAINLGLVMAQAGSRVLVIVADMRNPQLTRAHVHGAKAGLAEVLRGDASLIDVIWREPTTGVHILPTVARDRTRNSSELVASDAMRRLLEQVGHAYDYVILDCAPLAPVVDVRASAHLIDGFVLVSSWGETPIETIERVAGADYLEGKLIGSVLTKVDIKAYRLFETYQDSYYLDAQSPAA